MDQPIDVKAPEFDIRYMEPSDENFLKEWITVPSVIRRLPISDEKEGELFVQVWSAFNRYHCCLTATWKNVPCGMGIIYLMPYRKVAHRCLSQVVVSPQFPYGEIAGSLVKNLVHLAKSYFRLEWIQMEVSEGSPIIEPLKGCGFTEFARQERFFKEGKELYEARILFECDLRDGHKR